MDPHPLQRTGGYLPIEEHGVIGDLHTVALVGVDGTIDWCCLPRFDSPAVFGSLLDARKGGAFMLRSSSIEQSKQLYLPDSNVLMTRFMCPNSLSEVVDFMVPHDSSVPEGGRRALVRRLQSVRGVNEFQLRCDPAFDYARTPHTVTLLDGVGAVFEAAGTRLLLRSTVPLRVDGTAVVATFKLDPGERAEFLLEWGGAADANLARPVAPGEAEKLFDQTLRYWQRWLSRSRYQGRWREMVERSALCLKLLVYDPTGALVAAPTTSLPEALGGSRNWDYRFTWLRDAAFTLYGLMRLGFTEEAAAFMQWVEARCHEAKKGEGLRVMYGIDGRHDLHETVLDHLEGYRGSRPVRIGNGAADQLQLDVYGELMDSVYLYNKATPISYDLWVALKRQLDWLADNWQRPDEGIWETRGGKQRFTYSAMMTWVAFERAQRISRQRGLPAPDRHWNDIADQAYTQVQEQGWDPERRTYVQAFGSHRLDASILIAPLVKFVGPTDPRFLSTLERIREELVLDSLVYRYEADGSDGFLEEEGTFSLCSFWYVEALTRAGRVTEARLTFEKMLTYANHLGLYAEQIGPAGAALGNFPQAFTHLSLISAAFNLDRALGSSR
jgi:GH15 family glucan-1,4-alpha-glucosidase